MLSIFRVEVKTKALPTIENCLQNYTMSQCRRPQSTTTEEIFPPLIPFLFLTLVFQKSCYY
jgi:hypothetical protein